MGQRSRGGRATARKVRRKMCNGGGTNDMVEVGGYTPHQNSGSCRTTISKTATDVLDIDDETELQQFVDIEHGAVVLIPTEDSDG